MRKPRPLPHDLTAGDVVDRIRARYRDDLVYYELFPDPEHLAAVVDFALRRRDRLPKDQAQENVVDAVLLVRLAQEELDRRQLWALRAAKAERLRTKRLGPALGISTRQGIHDRIAALARKVTAARLHVGADALGGKITEPAGTLPLGALRSLAERLLACWRDLRTNPDIDEWAEEIELMLRRDPQLSPQAAVSIAAQMKIAVDDIDELARRTGQAPGQTPEALQVLVAVRSLDTAR